MNLVPPRKAYAVPVKVPDGRKLFVSVWARTKLGAQFAYWTTDWADPEECILGMDATQIGLPFLASELGKVP